MAGPVNESEEHVSNRCQSSFFAMWSYPNPTGKKDKELCDNIVVFGRHVIIFSVKYINLTDAADIEVRNKRWQQRAIDASAQQLYGAQRWLDTVASIKSNTPYGEVPLPPVQDRLYHRVAVALGSEGKVPLYFGELGRGFVHVLDEAAFNSLVGELNTIADFIEYLEKKQQIFDGAVHVLEWSETDLLAEYIRGNRSFPDDIRQGRRPCSWLELANEPAYLQKKEDDRSSQVWDTVIERNSAGLSEGTLEGSTDFESVDKANRVMASEHRFSRRVLSEYFIDYLRRCAAGELKARRLRSPTDPNVTYVFLALPKEVSRKDRVAELTGRCVVARGLDLETKVVVGIATEIPEKGAGSSFDVVYFELDEWTDDYQRQMDYLQNECGLFKGVQRMTAAYKSEYR